MAVADNSVEIPAVDSVGIPVVGNFADSSVGIPVPVDSAEIPAAGNSADSFAEIPVPVDSAGIPVAGNSADNSAGIPVPVDSADSLPPDYSAHILPCSP